MTVRQGPRVVGSVKLPCCQPYFGKMALELYTGESRQEGQMLCKITKCQINCHCMNGRQCGCCCDCAKYAVFDV